MTTTANDNDVVVFFGPGVTPCGLPVFVMTEAVLYQPKTRVVLHNYASFVRDLSPLRHWQAIDQLLCWQSVSIGKRKFDKDFDLLAS
ncbi:MAG: hypothetical protein ACPG3T_07595 [Pseudomonadales bacterium]